MSTDLSRRLDPPPSYIQQQLRWRGEVRFKLSVDGWDMEHPAGSCLTNPEPFPTADDTLQQETRTAAITRNDLPLCRPAMPTLPLNRSAPGDRLTLVFYACFSLPRHLASVWWRWKGLIANIPPRELGFCIRD